MGDRGSIFFVDRLEGGALEGIYMYTHWSGSTLPLIVRDALERGRGRWGDPQYLARVVFCELVKDSVLDETGYGLSTRLGDNEHVIVRVDDLTSRVSFHEPGKERLPRDPGLASWSFDEYLAARTADTERAFLGDPTLEPGSSSPKARAKARAKASPRAGGKARSKSKAKASSAANGKAKPKGNGHSARSDGKGNGHGARSRTRTPRRRAGAK
jgi:hypothetical protein